METVLSTHSNSPLWSPDRQTLTPAVLGDVGVRWIGNPGADLETEGEDFDFVIRLGYGIEKSDMRVVFNGH